MIITVEINNCNECHHCNTFITNITPPKIDIACTHEDILKERELLIERIIIQPKIIPDWYPLKHGSSY